MMKNRLCNFNHIIQLVGAMLLLLLTNAVIASIEDGISAVENEDYMSAYTMFKELAAQGDAEAQYNLAILYKQGKGVMQDADEAVNWFRKAAQQGLASAQYYMGHLYDSGEGVKQDFILAKNWYTKAAQQGNASAQSNLGVLYANGEGIKQDIVKAYVWFSLAVSQGLTAALDNRNLLAKSMSSELLNNATMLSREYFQQYVAPFSPQQNKLTSRGHPAIPNAHQQTPMAIQ
ncbi:MAG: sel1 repeat family protein [Gammaproteobacteria bacterium]|nr:sel1 repeat family protein [Gammaproteobacteria bacterium]